MNSCFEVINSCLDLDLLNGKNINKICFPCRHTLITKVVNDEFNIIDSSFEIDQKIVDYNNFFSVFSFLSLGFFAVSCWMKLEAKTNVVLKLMKHLIN